jgi:hypothetical protein
MNARDLIERLVTAPVSQRLRHGGRPPVEPPLDQGGGDETEAWRRLVLSHWPEATFEGGEFGLTAYAGPAEPGVNEVGNFESRSVVDQRGELHSLDESVRKCERCGKPLPADHGDSVYVCPLGWGCSKVGEAAVDHPTRHAAQAHLRQLRKDGFKGRAAIERDPRVGTHFIRRKEGELAPRKPQRVLTPYDRQIRQMVRYGTPDLHGALTDNIYSDERARREFEGDNPEASWEDAAADLAASYLSMHGIPRRRFSRTA